MKKIERIHIACDVAAKVRQAADSPKRRIHVVGKDGKEKGFVSEIDVAKGALALHEIQFSVVDGVRPKRKICEACGKSFVVPVHGRVARICGDHNDSACITCGRKAKPNARFPSSVLSRRGQRYECKPCSKNRRIDSITKTLRLRFARKIRVKGVLVAVRDLAEMCGISGELLLSRIRVGESIDVALTRKKWQRRSPTFWGTWRTACTQSRVSKQLFFQRIKKGIAPELAANTPPISRGKRGNRSMGRA